MLLPRSIKGRLLLWMFVAVNGLFAALGWCLHQKLHDIAFDNVDKMLHSNLQLVKGLVHTHDGMTVECETEEFMKGDYVTPRSGHYYKIFIDGKFLTASFSLSDWHFNLTPGTPAARNEKLKEWFYLTTGPDSEPLRVVRHEYMFMDKLITLVAAEDITASLKMIERMTAYFLVAMPVIIVLIAMISWGIAEFSLRPLQHFSASLENITHQNLNQRIEEGGLAKELRRLARKFNSLLARLHDAFEAEKHLIADAAHELKTPLAVIRAECDVALQKERPVGSYVHSLQEIRAVSADMLHQINDLLTLARLDSGMLESAEFQEVSLNTCLEDAFNLAEPLAARKNIKISMELPDDLMIAGDKSSLTEAILNVLENAVKYNHPGGFIAVEMSRRGRRAEVVVSDTGIGISPADMERIFDRFYRSDAARSMDGTGLGLSITKAVVLAHNGEITAASEPGAGSRFTLSLPLADAHI
jgi:hypothetical protein